MKKILIALLLLMALFCTACGSAISAPSTELGPTESSEPLPADELEMEQALEMPSYISNQVTVLAFQDGMLETTFNPDDIENQDYIVNYTVMDDTLIFDMAGNMRSLEDLKENSFLTVYTDAYAPAPLMMPVQYQADVIILMDAEDEKISFTCADTFVMTDGMLTGAGNTLALNLTEEVRVVDREGNTSQEELENKDLLVFYGGSTRSIPAQTTPSIIVVLGTNELALGSINAE